MAGRLGLDQLGTFVLGSAADASAGTTVSPGGIASAEAVGSPTVTPGSVTVSPTGISSAEAVGSPTVFSAQTVSPTGVADASSVGSPAVSSIITISPGGIISAEAIGSPAVTGGVQPQTVSPLGISGGGTSAPSFVFHRGRLLVGVGGGLYR